jgi:2-polyprenyl-6-hydroxyphenyl methylase/3-demethylubiquinone-9 3-methyltransferase
MAPVKNKFTRAVRQHGAQAFNASLVPPSQPTAVRERNVEVERRYFESEFGGNAYARYVEAYSYSKVVLRAKLIARHLSDGTNVLDLGCGTGQLTRLLATTHACIGLDLSRSQIAEATRMTAPTGRRSRYVVGSAYDLPFCSRTFGAVICSGSLHHLLDLDGALSEIDRVLDRGGRLIAVEPNRERSALIRLFADMAACAFRPNADPLAGVTFPRTSTERPLAATDIFTALKRFDYRIVSYRSHRFLDGFPLFRQPGVWRFVSLSLADPVLGHLPRFRRRGATFVVVAEKQRGGTHPQSRSAQKLAGLPRSFASRR